MQVAEGVLMQHVSFVENEHWMQLLAPEFLNVAAYSIEDRCSRGARR